MTGIIGLNGAGKSAVLKTLMGFLKPIAGEIVFDGRSLLGTPSHGMVHAGVGYVPQNSSLFLDLSVEDDLILGCWLIRRDGARVRRAIDRVLGDFPMLAPFRQGRARELSGGQRRFLEIARALLLEPKALLFDEPTAMIAPKYASEVYDHIARLARQGIAVILVDQNVRPCIQVSDYVYILELGQKTMEGDADAFLLRRSHPCRDRPWPEVSGGEDTSDRPSGGATRSVTLTSCIPCR
ncbi:UNVERIFIED_ORG: ABC-type branched-subunit amino acid transport system ATPase component [Xanthobacter viscosus]|nr:ATP-binding cassette domain-containing protein [Xanthobacter autotrophicus]